MGLRTVLDQIDPSKSEFEIVREEEMRFPQLARPMAAPPDSYFCRIQREWETTSAIVVNSNWSKLALRQQGVPDSSLFVVPLPFQPATPGTVRAFNRPKLRVLWLGTLCLRKGLPYAFAAAEQLADTPVDLTFAGPCEVNLEAIRLPANARYVGAVTRSEAADLYDTHDVFIFPTISDGFGLTQLEALSKGLPVIATTSCGEVVEDSKSGFLIKPRDSRGLADSIRRFVDEPDLLSRMSMNALRRSKEFRYDAIWPKYAAVLAGTARAEASSEGGSQRSAHCGDRTDGRMETQ
jgi:glycosyltransferase involved in cell wall biosynthesis